jgi:acylphosphatase
MSGTDPSERVLAEILISGRVQGVCYRAFALEEAEALGLCGWVRNLPDGKVQVEVEGPRERVEQLLDCLRKGPPRAQVTDLQVIWKAPVGHTQRFTIVG